MHNTGNENWKDWAAIVAMATVKVQTNMQLRGWYPSNYRTTTGFTGMRTSDQVKILQIRNGMTWVFKCRCTRTGSKEKLALEWMESTVRYLEPQHRPGDGCNESNESNESADRRPKRHPRNAAQQ
jgi:hypothetical protein